MNGCELCGNKCKRLEMNDGVCCFEYNLHYHLFNIHTEPCSDCKKVYNRVNKKIRRMK